MSLNTQTKTLNSIKTTLHCQEYWETQYQKWTIIDYYLKLIELNPTITKRVATGLLKSDLEALHVAFISEKDLKKNIENLQSELKKSADILTDFWNNHSAKLKSLALINAVDNTRVEAELKRKAVNNMTGSSSTGTSSETTPLVKRLRSRKNKETATSNDAERVECDQVLVTGCDISVGTMIKRAAYHLHKKSQPMTCWERKIMTSGLSSILDLSDNSFESQRSLFTDQQWEELQVHYENKFDTPLYKLDPEVEDCLTIACNTLELSNDYKCVINFVRKSHDKAACQTSKASLKIVESILNTIKSYQYLLSQPPTKDVTELDYYCTIWSPIFLLLFPTPNHVRVKAGESVNASSTSNKKHLYHESTHVKGFKIDFRFLADSNGEEYDIGVGECAKNSAIENEGKLTREAKDALDMILKVAGEQVATKVWIIQTSGPSCALSMLDIFNNGLYIAKHKYSFGIPSTTTQFKDTIYTTLRYLLTMKRDINKLADTIVSHTSTEASVDCSFNRKYSKSKFNPRLEYTRNSYYTPPKDSASKLPYHYYGPPPPSILNQLNDLSASAHSDRSASNNTTEPNEEDGQTYDIFGYKSTGDNKYYNKYTKKIVDEHPML